MILGVRGIEPVRLQASVTLEVSESSPIAVPVAFLDPGRDLKAAGAERLPRLSRVA
jgi:hypothetical protein